MNISQTKFLKAVSDFLSSDKVGSHKNKWIICDGIQMYIRLTKRYLNGVVYNTIDIANISVPLYLRGKGTFKELNKLCEKHTMRDAIFYESVLNVKLLKHFENPANNWIYVINSNPPCYYKLTHK